VREVRFFERDVRLRLPFRFGAVTLTEAPQAFVRARIELEDGRQGWGAAAELLAPKWFDKDPALSNADNVAQLWTALHIARELYVEGRLAHSAFRLFEETYHFQIAEGRRQSLNPLVASFGPALLDRAVLDALCRLHDVSFYDAMRANLAGMAPAEFLPEFAGFDFDGFLAALRPAEALHARHTVGLAGSASPRPISRRAAALDDGLPETLEDVVRAYEHTHFKLKVSGDVTADVARLTAIAGGARSPRRSLRGDARRQRAVPLGGRGARAVGRDRGGPGAAPAGGVRPLHRATDRPRPGAPGRRARAVGRPAAHHR
jgi:hypothetical protein